MKAFYEKVVEDVASREKETQRRIQQKTTRKINELEEKLLKIDERRYVEGDLPEDSYQRLKDKYSQELRKAKIRRRETSALVGQFSNHIKCAANVISDLETIYESTSIEGKDALLGSIFPGHLVFEDEGFRTVREEPIICLLTRETGK